MLPAITLNTIRSPKQYAAFLQWVDEMFDKKVRANSLDGEKLKVALLLIKEFEDIKYSIPSPDTMEATKTKVEEKVFKNNI